MKRIVSELMTAIALVGIAIGTAGASEPGLPLDVRVRNLGLRGSVTGKGADLATHVRIAVTLQATTPVDGIRVAVMDLVPTGDDLAERGRFEPGRIRWTKVGASTLRAANGSLSLNAGETVTAILVVPLKSAAFRHLTVEAVGQDSAGRPVRAGNRVLVAMGVPMPGPFHKDDTAIEHRAIASKEVSR